MKQSFTVKSIIGLCMVTLAVSCHKRGDFEVPCKLLKMSLVGQLISTDNYQGTVTYNSYGDPTDITWDNPGTGRPHHKFHYDKKHRLVRFDYFYSPTNYEIVRNYTWQGDRITVDTSWFVISDINDYRNTAWLVDTAYYTYDSKGRISKIENHGTYDVTTRIFTYDANGNLVNDGATYDNKVNFLRTNYWFMFVNRNFSMNNPRVADQYNKKGLPLSYQNTTISFYQSRLNQFEYSCDHKNH
jgi:hypothetical protein